MLWTFGEGRSSAAVNGTDLHGNGLLNLLRSSYLQSVSFILGRANALPSNTQGGSPVRESRSPGSVRGVLSNGHSYRDRRSRGSFVLKKRSRIRLQLVLCDDWHGNTGCLVAQDLALLTKVRTLIHEEISLPTVLYFPFRVVTPY